MRFSPNTGPIELGIQAISESIMAMSMKSPWPVSLRRSSAIRMPLSAISEAVAAAAGASLDAAAKVTIYLTDLAHFAKVNEAMAAYFTQPYPARAAIGVAALPRGALIEADAILVIE